MTKQVRTFLCVLLVVATVFGSSTGIFKYPVEAQETPSISPRPAYATGPLGLTVNTLDGTLSYAFDSLEIPAGKLPISVYFVYFSRQQTVNLGYGAGWQFSYNGFYVVNGNDYTVFLGDGSVLHFQKASDGTFTGASDSRDTFSEEESGRYVLTLTNHVRYEFGDPSHQRGTRIEEPNGNALVFAYDNQGRQITISDGRGRTFALEYAGTQLRRIHLLEDSRYDVSLDYNERNQLTDIVDQAGNLTHFTYDDQSLLTGITNPVGQSVAIQYTGERVSEISQGDLHQKYEYDLATTTTTIRIPVGDTAQITEYIYDTTGRLSAITDPSGGTTTYTWDDQNNPATITDALGRTTIYTYNDKGQVTAITSPANTTRTYDYDSAGNLVGIRDPAGQYTAFSYDALGNIVSSRDADGNETTVTYDALGNVASLTLPDSTMTQFAYAAGFPQQVTDALGNSSAYEFDLLGNLVSLTDPLGNVTQLSSNQYGDLTALTDPLGNTSSYKYDAASRIIGEQRSGGETHQYTYDALGRLSEVIDSAGNITSYSYDLLGDLVSITDANGNQRTFGYNVAGYLTSAVDALGNRETWTYDAFGNVSVYTDGDGKATRYSYYSNNHLERIDYSDGTSTVYTYDVLGRRTSMTDQHGTTRYSYNTIGRLTSVTTPDGKQVEYRYDAGGRLSEMISPDGSRTSYTYDVAGRLTQIVDPVGTFIFTYDAAGRMIGRAEPNGITATYEYDAASHMIGLHYVGEDGTLMQFSYEFDAGYRNIGITRQVGMTTSSERYQYDALGHLAEVFNQDGSFQRYSYDAVGNRASMETTDGTASYTYNAANQLTGMMLPNGQTISFDYDKTGALVQRVQDDVVTQYRFDVAQRLASVNKNGVIVDYTYDGDGNRISKTVNSERTDYILDYSAGLPRVMAEQGTDGHQQRYVLGSALPALAGENAGEAQFYLHDGLNSVVGLTGSEGTLLATYAYDSFGSPTTPRDENELFGFTGEPYDTESGLLYLRARYYVPGIGRFLTKDPVPGLPTLPQTLHQYVYALNSPLTFIDPTGLWPDWAEVGRMAKTGLYGISFGVGVIGTATVGAATALTCAAVVTCVGGGLLTAHLALGTAKSGEAFWRGLHGETPESDIPGGLLQLGDAALSKSSWYQDHVNPETQQMISIAASGGDLLLSILGPWGLTKLGGVVDLTTPVIKTAPEALQPALTWLGTFGTQFSYARSGISKGVDRYWRDMLGRFVRIPKWWEFDTFKLADVGKLLSYTRLLESFFDALLDSSGEIVGEETTPTTIPGSVVGIIAIAPPEQPPPQGVTIQPGIETITVTEGGALDLIFVIDTTGSMWNDIAAVQAQATTITNEIANRLPDYRIGLVTYRDFPVSPYGDPGDWTGRVEAELTTDANAIVNGINAITVGGGADWSESVYSGLMTALDMAWRDGATKDIILMGDAPPHDPEPFTGYTLDQVLAAAYAVDPAAIQSIVIGGDPEALQYFTDLANGSSGQVFTAATADEVTEAILEAIQSITVTTKTTIVWPPPPPIPLCADIGGVYNSGVRADVSPSPDQSNGIFCRVLAENGIFKYDGAIVDNGNAIGNADLIRRGISQAVDVYALNGGSSVASFDAPIDVCFLGTGDLYFLSARQSPRVPQLLDSFQSDGFTCGWLSEAGTLVLIGPIPADDPPDSSQNLIVEMVGADCQVTTTAWLRLRSQPGVESSILTVLPYNATYRASGRVAGWYEIDGQGTQGWVSGQFVTTENCG